MNDAQDVMQVCKNGHVITDLLRTCPERALTHCDRCGALTLSACPTCGHELPGAIVVPGMQTLGVRQPPRYCPICGVAFPWTLRRRPPQREAVVILENLLHRLPRVIRELRHRQGDRPPFRIEDERDLEDLLRALLPLYFDDVRPECRTPHYAAGTRTDFLLAAEKIAITVKLVRPGMESDLEEDGDYYRRDDRCRVLIEFIYDPQSLLREPPWPPADATDLREDLEVRCIVAT